VCVLSHCISLTASPPLFSPAPPTWTFTHFTSSASVYPLSICLFALSSSFVKWWFTLIAGHPHALVISLSLSLAYSLSPARTCTPNQIEQFMVLIHCTTVVQVLSAQETVCLLWKPSILRASKCLYVCTISSQRVAGKFGRLWKYLPLLLI